MTAGSVARQGAASGAPVGRRRLRPRRILRTAFLYLAMVIAIVVILAPFAWLLISSVADPVDLLARPLHWIPAHISFDRFAQLTITSDPNDQAQGFRSAIANSTIIASTVTVLSMVVGTLAAYAFARLHFPGRSWLILAFMATYMLPPIALILPLYQIMGALGLRDTPLALILIYSSFVTPFVIWIMRGYIASIPSDLDDAARVDGCSRLGALVRIIVPVARPGLLSTALLAFLLAWDEFLYALVLTSTNASKTLPVALNDFIGRFGLDFGLLATGGVIAAVPPVLIAFVFQRYIVAGLTTGGVKG
ncbi:MAG TPA: carbohydrate ABC transporter permease [Candidatus Limnocylindrales bacterium]|nr:carbohydrate ABC transporter permease [Candidatus Limnocylindrales bacterium]